MTDGEALYSLTDVYGPASTGLTDKEVEARLARSLQPHGPEMLLETAVATGLATGHRALDIGCRDALYACQLAERCGCTFLAVDPLPFHVARARARIAAAGLAAQVWSVQGRIEAIPLAAAAVDFIWCRDVLGHVPDLATAFRDCYRVLRPGGSMLIYVTLATPLLEPGEAARLYPPLSVVAANMDPEYVAVAWRRAGFRLRRQELIGSEWREKWEEDGRHVTARQLLTIARLRRDRAGLIAALGRKGYESELANCHWGVYQMLGKLRPMLYLLQRPT